MKCVHCGYESGDGFAFCPHCGRPLPQEPEPQPVRQEPAAPNESTGFAAVHILQVLKDPLFLVICILVSVSCVMSLAAGSIPIIGILAAVFLWLTYARSRDDIADEKHLRCISGTVYASYVIQNVLCIILLVVGVLLMACSWFVETEFAAFYSELQFELEAALNIELDMFPVTTEVLPEYVASLLVGMGIAFIVIGVVALIINLKGTRSIHRFAKSVYKSLETDQILFDKCRQAGTWLMVFGVLSSISTVLSLTEGDVTTLLAPGCDAATMIIGSILVKNHFAQWAQ